MNAMRVICNQFATSLDCYMRASIFLFALLLAGCANIVPITGGDEDVNPPAILKSSPMNESTFFTGQKVELYFDEYVQVKNAATQVVMSPPLKALPELVLRGKRLTISWPDTLLPNTTYLIQLGSAVTDITEGNALDSNVIAFSTGAHLDSFSISGTAISAETGEPIAEALVGLYPQLNDTLPLTSAPRYFTRTDERGHFELRYLAGGDYFMFGFTPTNSGYMYDQPDEAIAFKSSSVQVGTDSTEAVHELRFFTEPDTVQRLVEKSLQGTTSLRLVFAQPVQTLSTVPLPDTLPWQRHWNRQRDTLSLWFDSISAFDSLRFIALFDSLPDTVLVKPSQSKSAAPKGAETIVPMARVPRGPHPFFQPFAVRGAVPVAQYPKPEQFTVIENNDTVEAKPEVVPHFMGFDLDFAWLEGANYTVVLGDSAAVDRYGQANDTIVWKFKTDAATDYGSLQLTVDRTETSRLMIELRDSDDKTVWAQPSVSSQVFALPRLKAGTYSLRAVADSNANGEWDEGRLKHLVQPEEILVLKSKVEVRANWQNSFTWKVD